MNDVAPGRWAWAEVDLDAITHNLAVLREVAGPAAVWAVVKADGYGHGAVEVAAAALAAGAGGLCVALVQEAAELRRAGIDAPILVLTEQPPAELAAAVELGVVSTVWSSRHLAELVAAGAGVRRPHHVHLKVDTGMHRVGCEPAAAAGLAAEIVAAPGIELHGVFTHLAVADEPWHPENRRQLQRFDAVLAELAAAGIDPGLVHAANSAGLLAHPAARRAMVRVGIAMYGISPGPGVDDLATDLRPAMSLHARVSNVKRVRAGTGISYGLRHTFGTDTTVATVPIGYADGVPRRLFGAGGEVLIGGRRCPIVGVVTMDQIMVDAGDAAVAVGDHVVLIGRQGGGEITAVEWAERLGRIGYEIVCGISGRIERRPPAAPSGSGRGAGAGVVDSRA